MANLAASAPQVARCPLHDTIELYSHVLYRDAFLTLFPDTPLPSAFAERLRKIYRFGPKRRPVDQDFLNDIHDTVQKARDYHEKDDKFCVENLTTIFNVAKLIYRLDNLKDFEQDMKARLEHRLKCVDLLQQWDGKKEVGVWALDWRENLGSDLPVLTARSGKPRRGLSRKEAKKLERDLIKEFEEDENGMDVDG